MRKIYFIKELRVFFVALTSIFLTCSGSDDSSEPQNIIPSNLTANINIVGANSNYPNGDGSGIVTIEASANNAVDYVFKFPDNTQQQSNTGIIQHTFTTEGTNTYDITISAYSETENSISITESVTVYVDDGTEQIIPSNLEVSINIVGTSQGTPFGNGSGEVIFTSTAVNAVSYGFRINGNDEVISTDGSFEYVFNAAEGIENNNVVVKAYSSTNNSIQIEQEIPVAYYPNGIPYWADEFFQDGAPNPNNWNYDLGSGGWGNNELQTYTDNAENVIVSNGSLMITAKKNGTDNYTSARIKTQGLFSFKYGRVEVRAKLPGSIGTWPAIWLLGDSFPTEGWPLCGEIDIMEQTGQDKTKVLATCHWADPNNTSLPLSYGLETSVSNATTSFHVYAMEWDSNFIRMFVDDQQYYIINISEAGITNSPFQDKFFFILNVAVGGTLGGQVPNNFNQSTMEIDYVRVYQ